MPDDARDLLIADLRAQLQTAFYASHAAHERLAEAEHRIAELAPARAAQAPPAAPSAWQIERTLAAWHQAREALAADLNLMGDENAITEALGTDPQTATPDQLLERLINATVWAEARTEEARHIAAEFAERVRRYDRRGEVLRQTLMQLMQTLQRKRHDASMARATLARAADSMLVIDEAQVPDSYVTSERKLRRREMLADLKEGVVIAGATLVTGGVIVQLRKH